MRSSFWREFLEGIYQGKEGDMFVTTPEIVWHNKEPIFSVDLHHSRSILRIATAGADHTVKIWRLIREGAKTKLVFFANLDRHTKSVNVVKFATTGEYLASAGDDCTVCLWKLNEENDVAMETNLEDVNMENWTVAKMLRGHIEDVYDLSWSSDSRYLLSGSVDNTAIVWDTLSGDKLAILKESQHYVQGVAWNPKGGCVATLGTDRNLRVYKIENNKFKCIHSVSKYIPTHEDRMKPTKLFQDESISSFFRRLCFSPDGSLLVAPSGKIDNGDKSENVTWVFTKSSLPKPVMYLPGTNKASVVVRFSPILYELNQSNDETPLVFDLPYRMVYAVGTSDTVLLYDTQQTTPIGLITDIHYTSITDLSWSYDGTLLLVSSTDGYCTIIGFDSEELGKPYLGSVSQSPTNPGTLQDTVVRKRIKPIPLDNGETPIFNKLSGSTDDTSSIPSPVYHTPTNDKVKPSRRITPIRVTTSEHNSHETQQQLSSKTPRRVEFITLSGSTTCNDVSMDTDNTS